MLTQERLKELFRYDAKTGHFFRIKGVKGFAAGSRAGTKNANGYITIGVDGVRYYASRLAWLWATGKFPEKSMDHKNGVRDDNRFVNLREATKRQNGQNVIKSKNNTSGYLGVTFDKNRKKWSARLSLEGVNYHLGRYDTPKEAYRAYLAAKKKLHTFQPIPRSEL